MRHMPGAQCCEMSLLQALPVMHKHTRSNVAGKQGQLEGQMVRKLQKGKHGGCCQTCWMSTNLYRSCGSTILLVDEADELHVQCALALCRSMHMAIVQCAAAIPCACALHAPQLQAAACMHACCSMQVCCCSIKLTANVKQMLLSSCSVATPTTLTHAVSNTRTDTHVNMQ
jgi:hypothetical protein